MKLPEIEMGEFCIRYAKVEASLAADSDQLVIYAYIGVKLKESGEDDFIVCRARCAGDAPRELVAYHVQNALRAAVELAVNEWLRIDGQPLPCPRELALANANAKSVRGAN